MLGRRRNGGWVKYKIIDIDGTEISIEELLDRYFFSGNHHTSCSVIETKSYNNVVEESSIVKEDCEIKDSPFENPENSPIDDHECSYDRFAFPLRLVYLLSLIPSLSFPYR